jgi:hypothetical protein
MGDGSGNPELRTQDLQPLGDSSPWGSSARRDNYGAMFFVRKSLTLRATEPQGL